MDSVPPEPLVLAVDQLRRMSDDLALGLYLVDARSSRALYANHRFFELWGLQPLEEPFRRGECPHSQLMQQCLRSLADTEVSLRMSAPPAQDSPPKGTRVS